MPKTEYCHKCKKKKDYHDMWSDSRGYPTKYCNECHLDMREKRESDRIKRAMKKYNIKPTLKGKINMEIK